MSPVSTALPPVAPSLPSLVSRGRPVLPWVMLVALLAVAQTLLVGLTVVYENKGAQEQVDAAAAAVSIELRQHAERDLEGLQALQWNDPTDAQWRRGAELLLHRHPELLHIEKRPLQSPRLPGNASVSPLITVDSPYRPPLFSHVPRTEMAADTELACATAQRHGTPAFSRSYFVPFSGGQGIEVIDVCLPVSHSQGGASESVAATLSMPALLSQSASMELLRGHELSFVEADGTRLARAGLGRGGGVYVAQRLIDLPGQTLVLRVDSAAGRPRLIPPLAVSLVLGLSLALGVVVVLLVRDMRRRYAAENALAEALAFRRAMEDSLITGMRARDLQGRVTYVNLAFCRMVGLTEAQIIGCNPPPYWPPELVGEYNRRQQLRMDGLRPPGESQQGFETIFLRGSGERFAVLIFEAPLVDGGGRHTGWMSAVLDVSEQRRVEELSRQQQERLQATARLATVGEMASLLSHELNQPLAAIASYAAGSLNVMGSGGGLDADAAAALRHAAMRIAEQAERAGRVIKSVHDFVRRREQAHEPLRCDVLIEAVLPLVRLQARKSGARIEVERIEPGLRVQCDRTMVEQVLLNLTRNGIQAMELDTPVKARELRIKVASAAEGRVVFRISDRGPGISPEVAQRLFTPFFTTRPEGMGLGLSLCRTVVEQHGGTLDFTSLQPPASGTEFRFTLPAPAPARKPAPPRPLSSLTTDDAVLNPTPDDAASAT